MYNMMCMDAGSKKTLETVSSATVSSVSHGGVAVGPFQVTSHRFTTPRHRRYSCTRGHGDRRFSAYSPQ